jgi:hypothetical protein
VSELWQALGACPGPAWNVGRQFRSNAEGAYRRAAESNSGQMKKLGDGTSGVLMAANQHNRLTWIAG